MYVEDQEPRVSPSAMNRMTYLFDTRTARRQPQSLTQAKIYNIYYETGWEAMAV